MFRAHALTWLLTLAILCCAGNASASILTPTGPCAASGTLTSFLGVTCSVGPLTLGRFGYSATASGNATAPTAANLTLTTSFNPDTRLTTVRLGGFNCTVDPALHTAQNTSCFDALTASDLINELFNFTIDPGPIIDTIEITLDPPFGNVVGQVTYCPGGTLDGTFCTTTGTAPTGRFTPGSSFHQSFAPPLQLLELDSHVTVTGGPSGFDGIIYSIHTIADAPEPGSLALLGGGLLGLGFLSRRRRRS